MNQPQLQNLLLDQSKDLFWMVNSNFQLIYANKAYLSLMEEVAGVEKKLNETVFVEGFGGGYVEKWKVYYNMALKGAYFEIEEHYYHPASNKVHYSQVTFEPLIGEDDKFFAVACQSKDITHIVKQRTEANHMMDASLDVFCTINEQGNFVYVNAAAANNWGYLPDELIGKPFHDLILEEDVLKTNEIFATIFSGQKVKSFVNRYKKKDGGIAYNLWSARWDNITQLLYCVGKDCKEQVEQEEIILLSEQRFKALVQEGADLVGILDVDGNYIYVSPTSYSILGIAPEEFIGRNALEFIHQDDVARTLACLQKVTTEKRVIVEPFRFQNHQKEWRWMETVLTNMLDNSAVKGIVANSRDITDKMEEKHKLKLLESVITNTNDAIMITEAEPLDHPGPKIIYVNQAFTKMTGYEAKEVIGKTPRIMQGPNSNKEELAKMGRSLRNWEPCEITIINYKKSGEEFWITFSVTPIADEKGWYTHWISIERDVTEQKISELENKLVAQISVDFNSENNYISAANEVCKSISKFGKFDWVEIWITNLRKNEMQLFSHYVADPEDKKLYDLNNTVNEFKISEGFAGKVWYEQSQILWDNIEENNDFVRIDIAKKIGLKALLGIPLIFNKEVIGVLKIGTKQNANYLKNYVKIFKQLEMFIGSELNRKKLENDLSRLLMAIPDILCLIDFQGKFLKMNQSGCSLLGYSEEEILYYKFEEFVHPLDKGIFSNQVMSLEKEETIFKFEIRHLTKNGEIVWLSWYCNPSLKEGIIYATAKNITEEKKLRELNRQVGSLVKIGSWEMDLVSQSLFWSDEVHQLHETDSKSFAPNLETAINFYREDFRQIVRLNIEKCISTKESFDFEAVLVTAKKKEMWVRSTGNAEFINGVCKRLYGSFQDIDERKKAEENILQSNERFEKVTEATNDAIWDWDIANQTMHRSQAIERFFGKEASKSFIGSDFWKDNFHPEDIVKIQDSTEEAIANPSTTRWELEYRALNEHGKILYVRDRALIIRNNEGKAIRMVGAMTDITEQKKMTVKLSELNNSLQQHTLELIRSNEELEQFAFVASHDLQEPLRMISSFMDLLQRKYGNQLDEKAHQYIHFATDGAKKMKQIILDLLDYSRSNKLTEGKAAIDVNEVLSEFKQLRRKLISEKSATIKSNDLPTLNTYKAAITQILHCLLENALKYSIEGRSPIIELNAEENETAWKFSVKDNGIGIDPQFYDKIFIIFQRLHNKDQYSGTGIGLSIAKRHVEFLGGRIWLESEPGEGTIFYFTIPKNK